MYWHQDSDRRVRNTAAVIVFGGLFGFVGAILFVLLVVLPLVQTLRVAGWVAVPCVIMSSGMQTHAGETREVYDIAVRYSYTYEGSAYEGDRYRLYPLRTSDRAEWQAIAGRVTWELESKAEAIIVRQAWKTSGRGEQDTGLGSEQWLACHAREGEAMFELPALDGPYSYQGKLFDLRWMIEVTAEPNGPKAWQAFTLSPTGATIRA